MPPTTRSPSWRQLTITLAWLSLVASGCGGGTEPEPNGHKWDPRVLWVFQADATMYYGSPALSADETRVYVGTSTGLFGAVTKANGFYALSTATGEVIWKHPLGHGEVRSAPAVAADGSIYFLVQRRSGSGISKGQELLYHLSAAGDSLWAYDVNSQPRGMDIGLSAPALGPDGTVHIAGDALYAIRPDGSLKWKALEAAYEDLRNSPTVASDGTVYFVFHNIPLTALDPADGRILWSTPLDETSHFVAPPSIGVDGTIYVASDRGRLYAVSSGGELRWSLDTATIGYPCAMRSSPAVSADGTIFLGTNSGNPASIFLAVRPNGSVKWMFTPANLPPDVPPSHFDIYSSPCIGSDGTVYFGQEFGRVYALDPAGGALKWMVPTQDGITWCSPALTRGGVLLIADLSGKVFAIRTDSRGLEPGSPWPRYRHDNGGSGRSGGQ